MPEEKKRFPWWLVVCAAILVPLAAVLGFIETVGRQGTLFGRYKNITRTMPKSEILSILGPPASGWHDAFSSPYTDLYHWREGPIGVRAEFDAFGRVWDIERYRYSSGDTFGWHVRGWAEQAYTAIHGRRH